MELYKITVDGRVTLLNGDNVLTIIYDEQEQRLTLKFINGDTLGLDGGEAAEAWTAFSDEIINDERTNTENSEIRFARSGMDEDEDDEEREPFEPINREIAALELQIERKSVTRTWDARQLRESADELGAYWDKKKKRQYADELKGVRARAYAVADEAETIALVNTLNDCATTPIVNNSSVKSILRRLQEVEEDLQRSDKMTDELKQKVRTAKERVAWYRAKKKLADADIALAGGSHTKGEKYKREASMLIKQDWAEVFLDEEPPQIENLVSDVTSQPTLLK